MNTRNSPSSLAAHLRPVDFDYIWGDALLEMKPPRTDVRIINRRSRSPKARILARACAIASSEHRLLDCGPDLLLRSANNHLLDWGGEGLQETLGTLDAAVIARAGAGRNVSEAGGRA